MNDIEILKKLVHVNRYLIKLGAKKTYSYYCFEPGPGSASEDLSSSLWKN